VTLTFKPQICSSSSPVWCYVSAKLELSITFYISRKSEAREGRTDRRTDGVQQLMRPLGMAA